MSSRRTPPPLPKAAVGASPPADAPGTIAARVAAGPARTPRRGSLVKRAVLGLITLAAVVGGSAWLLDASIDPAEEARALPPIDRAMVAGVKSWGYQLQRVDVAKLAGTPLDLVVIDEAIGDGRRPASVGRTLASLRHKPDGSRRLVLSYLSIGEAEDYRPYWQTGWVVPAEVRPGGSGSAGASVVDLASVGATPARANVRFMAPTQLRPLRVPAKAAPAWLGDENAEWRGNYRVRFWHPDWQKLIFGHPEAALDRLIAAGFDGVYLDRADVYELWKGEHPTAKTEMAQLIERLAGYARHQRPGFLVVMQNAEELLTSASLRSALDAVAKEDLLFGIEGEGRANSPSDVEASLKYLQLARKDGLPVLAVEYLSDAPSVAAARRRLEVEGFIPYFAPRWLNALGTAG